MPRRGNNSGKWATIVENGISAVIEDIATIVENEISAVTEDIVSTNA